MKGKLMMTLLLVFCVAVCFGQSPISEYVEKVDLLSTALASVVTVFLSEVANGFFNTKKANAIIIVFVIVGAVVGSIYALGVPKVGYAEVFVLGQAIFALYKKLSKAITYNE